MTSKKDIMKATREYISLLKAFKEKEGKAYGISRMCVFGSVARGEQQEDSDVDVCIECPPMGLFAFGGIKERLEQLLGCHVDLIRFRERMNAFLREQIEREGIYV